MTEYTYGRNKTLLFKLQHEVRQALHSMMGMLELAAEEPSAAARADYLSRCRSSADSLLQIAKDVDELAEAEPASWKRWRCGRA
jgi:signal transduction histidine kinase